MSHRPTLLLWTVLLARWAIPRTSSGLRSVQTLNGDTAYMLMTFGFIEGLGQDVTMATVNGQDSTGANLTGLFTCLHINLKLYSNYIKE